MAVGRFSSDRKVRIWSLHNERTETAECRDDVAWYGSGRFTTNESKRPNVEMTWRGTDLVASQRGSHCRMAAAAASWKGYIPFDNYPHACEAPRARGWIAARFGRRWPRVVASGDARLFHHEREGGRHCGQPPARRSSLVARTDLASSARRRSHSQLTLLPRPLTPPRASRSFDRLIDRSSWSSYFLVVVMLGAMVLPTVLIGVISIAFDDATRQVAVRHRTPPPRRRGCRGCSPPDVASPPRLPRPPPDAAVAQQCARPHRSIAGRRSHLPSLRCHFHHLPSLQCEDRSHHLPSFASLFSTRSSSPSFASLFFARSSSPSFASLFFARSSSPSPSRAGALSLLCGPDQGREEGGDGRQPRHAARERLGADRPNDAGRWR